MRKGIMAGSATAGLLLFVLIVSAAPVLVGQAAGHLRLHWGEAFRLIGAYLTGLGNGDSFRFFIGRTPHDFLREVWSYFALSFFYLTVSGLLAVTFGIVLGMWFSRSKREWAKELLDFFSTLPDFILILLLQLLVVVLYHATGVSFFKVASLSTDNPALALPLAAMTVVPGLYLMRIVSVHTYQILTEEYVLSARAKGLGVLHIYLYHVLPNVTPFLKADSHKLLGIMMSNLFIVEYLFNLRGMTRLLFSSVQSRGGYQYQLAADTFLLFVILYIAIYLVIRLYLRLLERRFAV